MATIADGGTIGVHIHAYLSNGGDEWPSPPESWPVHLGLGVTLAAPAILFRPQPFSAPPVLDAFDVYPYSQDDSNEVTIEGSPTDPNNPIEIGLPTISGNQGSALVAVADPPLDLPAFAFGLPIRISNAWLVGSNSALLVTEGASAILGTLPVHIGSNSELLPVAQGESIGILCGGSGGAVTDTGSNSVEIDSQAFDIAAYRGCSIQLVHSPHLGLLPDGGFGSCPLINGSKADNVGILAVDDSTVTIGSEAEPAEIHCHSGDAIKLSSGNWPGPAFPTVIFTGHQSNASCRGADLYDGALAAFGSSFTYNTSGIWFLGGALNIDNFEGLDSTTIACNSAEEDPAPRCPWPPLGQPYSTGVTVSSARQAIDLNTVAWNHWDATAIEPQIWTCFDDLYQVCQCSGPGCPDAGGLIPIGPADSPDLVYNGAAVDAGRFIFTSGSAATSCP
jgi:hypothetical protein